MGTTMKTKSTKLGLLSLSILLLHTPFAWANSGKTLVTSDGKEVIDRFGDCVITEFGSRVEKCDPRPKTVVKPQKVLTVSKPVVITQPQPVKVVKPKQTITIVQKPIVVTKKPAPAKPITIIKKPRKPVVKKPKTLRLSADAYFDFDKAILKPEGRTSLSHLAQKLRTTNLHHIKITGHTDSFGSHAYNHKLSWRRAFAAADFLVQQGIPEHKISIQGFGETTPIASNETTQGQAKNRRIELQLHATY